MGSSVFRDVAFGVVGITVVDCGTFVEAVGSTVDVDWVVACTSVCFSLVVFGFSTGSVVTFAVVEGVPVTDVVGEDKAVDEV